MPTQKSTIEDKSAAAGARTQAACKAQTQAAKSASTSKRASTKSLADTKMDTPSMTNSKPSAPKTESRARATSAPAQEGVGSQQSDAARIREANIQAMLNDDVQLERQPVLPRYLKACSSYMNLCCVPCSLLQQ